MKAIVRRPTALAGKAHVPGDKSISHRALILAALAEGICHIEGLSDGADVRSTAACLRALGVRIDERDGATIVHGVGLRGLRPPKDPLDCGNSGTTMRLLAGVLAGSGVGGTLDGDASLRRRPMERVLSPLRAMGARCTSTDGCAPLHIEPGAPLHGMAHDLAVASAQVKSALLLAGLWADGATTVCEPALSRDHTERMLAAFGASIVTPPAHATARALAPRPCATIHTPTAPLRAPARLAIPGDPSSAAFLLAAALLVPGGALTIRGVDVNPTRAGFLAVLARMGAHIDCTPRPDAAGDPVADLVARHAPLHATTIQPHEIPALVDEVPLLAVVAATAAGTTKIRGAEELRVKESDRLAATAAGLRAMGAQVDELLDGLRIHGPARMRGAAIDPRGDHRIAMAFAIAGLAADGTTTIDGADCADVSFPGFYELLAALTGGAVHVA